MQWVLVSIAATLLVLVLVLHINAILMQHFVKGMESLLDQLIVK